MFCQQEVTLEERRLKSIRHLTFLMARGLRFHRRPAVLVMGHVFFVGTPNATSITKVTMIALGSVTHGFNMSQRFLRPSFSLATGGLNVTAPSNANNAPPGYYMLFILNGSGVPSVAKIIQLSGTGNPTPTPTQLRLQRRHQHRPQLPHPHLRLQPASRLPRRHRVKLI